jgi:stringent starvation protein B
MKKEQERNTGKGTAPSVETPTPPQVMDPSAPPNEAQKETKKGDKREDHRSKPVEPKNPEKDKKGKDGSREQS